MQNARAGSINRLPIDGLRRASDSQDRQVGKGVGDAARGLGEEQDRGELSVNRGVSVFGGSPSLGGLFDAWQKRS
jgi:hypothetical protein